VELQYLLLIDLDQHAVIDPDSTVSCRTLTLEHAQHRLAFFFEELPRARIRKAPQLPVVQQIPRALRNPGSKQKIQVPSLVVVLQCAIAHITGQTANVEGKPLQHLTAPGSQQGGKH